MVEGRCLIYQRLSTWGINLDFGTAIITIHTYDTLMPKYYLRS